MFTNQFHVLYSIIVIYFLKCCLSQPPPIPFRFPLLPIRQKLNQSLNSQTQSNIADYSIDEQLNASLVNPQSEVMHTGIKEGLTKPVMSGINITVSPRSSDVCGIEATTDRIVNGEDAGLFEYPWLALLFYQVRPTDPIRYKCGGTLINQRTVITAAHCVEGRLGEQFKFARLGEWDISTENDCLIDDEEECADPPVDIEAERIIIHPERNATAKINDLALIILKEKPPYTDSIRPICLPSKNFEPEDINSVAQALLVAGWGSTHEIVKNVATIKQKLKLDYFPFDECSELFKGEDVHLNSEQIICAGGAKGKGACRGDSGGPLMFWNKGKYSLAGVVSFGYGRCAQANKPAVFTHVWTYNNWIQQNSL